MDIYEVGVKLSLGNGVSATLGPMMRDLMGFETKVTNIGSLFEKWTSALKASGEILAGVTILGSLDRAVERGEKLLHVQEQMNQAGMKQAEIAESTQEAWSVAMKYGLSVTEVMNDIKETRMVYGSTQHALEFIEPLEQMRVVLNSVLRHGEGDKAKEAVYEAARAGELKGLQTPEQFNEYFNMMTKAASASGGKVTPHDFMVATQYGRIAVKSWNEEFYGSYLPSLIQEQGASQAGTSLMSLYGANVQGRVTKRSLTAMDEIGLITDKSKIIYDAHGDPKGFRAGALDDTEGFQSNPFKWAQTTLREHLENKFGNYEAGDQRVLAFLSEMYGNRTAAQQIAILTLEGNRLGKDAGLINQAQDKEGWQRLIKQDPTAVMNAFSAAWNNLLTSLGGPMVEGKIEIIKTLTSAMNGITSWATEHQDAIRGIGTFIGVLAEGLTALGIFALGELAIALVGAIGVSGWIVLGISALAGVISYFDKNLWNDAVDWISKLFKAISNGVKGIGSWFWKAITFSDYKETPYGTWNMNDHVKSSAIPPPQGNASKGSVGDVYLDGDKVGEHLSKSIARQGSVPSSGGYVDGRSIFTPPDFQFGD